MGRTDPPQGRDAELNALGSGPRGEALVLLGPAGVGKSALIEVVARRAADAGARVVSLGTAGQPGTVDYGCADELLEHLHADLARLPAPDREALLVTRGMAAGPMPERMRVSAALLTLLRRAGEEKPLLVVAFGAHAYDRPTALLLAFVARRLADSRVGLIVELREHAGVFHRCGRLVVVEPLGPEPAGRLLLERYPDLTSRACERLVAEAGGIPATLLDLAAALGDDVRRGHAPLPARLPVGPRTSRQARGAVAVLPATSREVLLLAALGASGLIELQAAAPGTDVVAALDPAERGALVSVAEPGRRVRFASAALRSAVVQLATDVERRRARQALAASLTDDPLEQVWHLADAAEDPDARLADRLAETAQAALRRGDAESAVAALCRSAELSPDPEERTLRMLEAAFIHADVTGDLAVASRLIGRARATGGELAGSVPLAVAASYVALNSRMGAGAAHQMLASALGAYPGPWDSADDVLVDALHLLLVNCWTIGGTEAWAPFHEAAGRLRPTVPPLLELGASAFGDPARVTAAQLEAITGAAEALRDEHDPVIITRTALACIYTDRLAACSAPLRRVIDGNAGAVAVQATAALGHHLWHTGQWADLDTLVAADRHGLGIYQPAMLAAVRGDTKLSLALAGELAEWGASGGSGTARHFAAHVRALVAVGQGDFAAAYHEAASVSPAGTRPPNVPHALWLLLELVEGALRSDRSDAARAHVEAMSAAGLDRISPRLALITRGCAAMVSGDPADFERALAVPGVAWWPFDLARVQLAYGEELRRRRETVRARRPLAASLEVFRRLGAWPWIRRAESQLRAGGHRSGANTTVAAPGDSGGLPALSAQERVIAELVAAGLSNKQVAERLRLSHRTVGAHLYRIFPKLGITSRAGLRDALNS